MGAPVYKSKMLTKASDGTYEFVASDETPDRHGDIVRAAGWDLSNYRKNPVVLFGHKRDTPVGRAVKTWIEDKVLKIKIKMAEEGTSPFIDTLIKLMDQDIVRAVSVGFLPTLEPKYIRDPQNDRIIGLEFVGQELLENSIVTVPANPRALAAAKSMGARDEHIQRIFDNEQGAMARMPMNKLALDMARLGATSNFLNHWS